MKHKSIINNKLDHSSNVLFLFAIMYISYYLLSSSFPWYTWYFYPAVLASAYMIPKFSESLSDALSSLIGIHLDQHGVHILFLTFAIIFMAISGILIFQPSGFEDDTYQLALDMNEELPEDDVLAWGDRAGAFSYFSDNRVVQTECLTQDYRCVESLRDNSLESYLSSNNVDYLFGRYVGDQVYSPAKKRNFAGVRVHVCQSAEAELGVDNSINTVWKVDRLSSC
jgi:hypothetical protein